MNKPLDHEEYANMLLAQNDPGISGEDIMDLEAPDRISLQDMGRSEREKKKRLSFLYE